MRPHKHAELIKAWADGAEIEKQQIYCKYQMNEEPIIVSEEWFPCPNPTWVWNETYRIKPESKPEPVKKTMYLYFVGTNEQKFWISDEPPETYVYRTISQYIGSIEVTK